MKLHLNKKLFEDTIIVVADQTGLNRAIIEKDYFVTLMLKTIVAKEPNTIFKGGTSLSKCYKIIDRFSEDIDLNLDNIYEIPWSERSKYKAKIIESAQDLNLVLANPDQVKDKQMLNHYKIKYPNNFEGDFLKPLVEVETYYRLPAYPYEEKEATCIIYDYLVQNDANESLIETFHLHPFKVKTQTKERTFIDKTFAICDYYLEGRVERLSRHIYDLHMLLPLLPLNKETEAFFKEIRKIRTADKKCHSAPNDVDICEILNSIIETDYFKPDYEKLTFQLINEKVSYEDVITSIKVIRDWILTHEK